MSNNTVILDGKSLTIQDIVNVARKGFKIERHAYVLKLLSCVVCNATYE